MQAQYIKYRNGKELALVSSSTVWAQYKTWPQEMQSPPTKHPYKAGGHVCSGFLLRTCSSEAFKCQALCRLLDARKWTKASESRGVPTEGHRLCLPVRTAKETKVTATVAREAEGSESLLLPNSRETGRLSSGADPGDPWGQPDARLTSGKSGVHVASRNLLSLKLSCFYGWINNGSPSLQLQWGKHFTTAGTSGCLTMHGETKISSIVSSEPVSSRNSGALCAFMMYKLQCTPQRWQGSKQWHGGVFRLLPSSYGGHLYNKKQGPPRVRINLPHNAERHNFLGPRGAAPGTRDRGRRRRWGGTCSTGWSLWNPPERLLGTFLVTREM